MGTLNISIADALFTKVQQRVLSILYSQPDRTFFGNEIVRIADVGVGAVRRELDKLTSSGLVSVSRIGNQKHYQANKKSPIFLELRGIIIKTFGVADVLRKMLLPFADRIQAAFIYGSVARGQDSAKSDIDLMLISDGVAYPDLFALLGQAEQQLGRTVNPTLYTQDELSKKLSAGNDFISRILEQPKIYIIGVGDDISQSH